VSGSTVVFKHAGVEFAGYDAIIEVTRLAGGGLGRLASRLLSVAPVRLLGNRAYGWVARHRHTISRLLPGVKLTQLDTRDGPRNDKPLDL
jgi:predicted DCC family thiol-disulfide oxidoreductase YuxK